MNALAKNILIGAAAYFVTKKFASGIHGRSIQLHSMQGIGSFNDIPTTLKKFVSQRGLFVTPIKFRFYGQWEKGYSIYDDEKNELVVLEPVHYSNGDRWLISKKYARGIRYAKNLPEVVKIISDVTPGPTGFKIDIN